MQTLATYSLFHLNLNYSSLDVAARPEVIKRCYWPLLRLASEYCIPIAIECPGYTLENIAVLDPEWIQACASLIQDGLVELIGSGYCQLIGPLVPAEVVVKNLQLGQKVYQDILRVTPAVALINEQAFSSGLVEHYLSVGFKAIMMEWNNVAHYHPEWAKEWLYHPQYAAGIDKKIPIIWTESISFQKFQRYVFGEYTAQYYLDFVLSHESNTSRVTSLYSNDAEVIGFRPGRFRTEAPIVADEWQRVYDFYLLLAETKRVQWLLPHQMLDRLSHIDAGHTLSLVSAEQPIPVKKQFKYNISRWAVTGRDDMYLNSQCYRILNKMLAKPALDTDAYWRQLCKFWSSDYRTHITESRWMRMQKKLSQFSQKIGLKDYSNVNPTSDVQWKKVISSGEVNGFSLSVDSAEHRLTVQNDVLLLELNLWRGIAIQSLAFADHDFNPIIGTLHHGYFDSIALGADFYSGTTVIELVESHSRLTDLVPVDVYVAEIELGIMLQCSIVTQLGTITKTFTLTNEQALTYRLAFEFTERPRGVVRVGNFTLVNQQDENKRWYQVKNGGTEFERYTLGDRCAHCEAASTLVSARTGLGATTGEVEIGDQQQGLQLSWNPADCAAFPMICHEVHGRNNLTRVVFSLAELDETSMVGGRLLPFTVTLKPRRGCDD